MTHNEFIDIVEQVKKSKPILFELEHDKCVSENEIVCFESANSMILPIEYKQFVLEFGGGYFGFVNMYSLDLDSSFYLLANQNGIPDGYLAISDNGCGDYYVIKFNTGNVASKVMFFEHESQKIVETDYEDIYEYLVVEGLRYPQNRLH